MKTLKQIREEYDSNFINQVENLPDDIMLGEAKDSLMGGSPIPSYKDMPMMLLFKRISYRVYPNKQVVALYYSHMVDKYLSIPFGPKGNLNLSEAVILTSEEVESLDENPLAAVVAGARTLAAGAAKKVMKGARRYAMKKIGDAIVGRSGTKDSSAIEKASQGAASAIKDVSTAHLRPVGTSSVKSSWSKATPSDATYQSKMKAAAEKEARTVKENKMTDIRKMVNEGHNTMDININGKQVTLNTSMAKRILEVYDSVNTKNKKIVEGMLNEDLESFKRLLNFSIRK